MPQAEKPAMFSGPGAMSQRTDGGPASKQAQRYISGMPNYGDGQQLMDLQASAPMASTPGPKAPSKTAITQAAQTAGPMQAMQPQAPLTPLSAPTQRPNEPVMTGVNAGAGLGASALGPQQDQVNYQNAKQYLQSMASNPTASPALKAIASRFNGSI